MIMLEFSLLFCVSTVKINPLSGSFQVMEAEQARTRSEAEHRKTAANYNSCISHMRQLEKKLKRSINKSRFVLLFPLLRPLNCKCECECASVCVCVRNGERGTLFMSSDAIQMFHVPVAQRSAGVCSLSKSQGM